MEALGFTGNLGLWLGDFLTRHHQAVKVGAGASTWARVLSGIP